MRLLLVMGLLFASGSVSGEDPTYVGDGECRFCHSGIYNDYVDSGHRWKITHTAGETPELDSWPWTDPPRLPIVGTGTVDVKQLEWSDVEYVIGNFFWKARFIDHDGYIYTGTADDKTQYNLATDGFVGYHAGEYPKDGVNKPFDCGRCHTTGYQFGGNQGGLPGLHGTWALDGVQCEACHGPASLHIDDPRNVKPTGGKDCAECHYRDGKILGDGSYAYRMPWKGGFTRHHQQAEDFSHSPHAFFRDGCNTCHEPHRSTVYGLGGVTKECTTCHSGNEENNFYAMEEGGSMADLACIDCHMARMGKNAAASNTYTGDIRAHLFRIMTDPVTREENTYVEDGGTFWGQEDDGSALITLDYACVGCHMDQGGPLEDQLDVLALHAKSFHEKAANGAPDVDPGGPYSGFVGTPVEFDASGTTDPEGDPMIFMWLFEGNPAPAFGETASHTWSEPGIYTVMLTVSDPINVPIVVELEVEISDAPPPPETDTWRVKAPFAYLHDEFLATFEEFAGILVVDVEYPDGEKSMGIGMEWNGVIYWMDMSYSIFFGNVNHNANTMSGVAFFDSGVSIWFAEPAL